MWSAIKNYPELGENSQKVNFKITTTKHIRISIKSSLQITVSFPKYCSLKKAQSFFESKFIWIQNSLQKLQKRQEIQLRHQQNQLINLDEKGVLDRTHYLILRCRQLAQTHNFAVGRIILRKQKTIWGSCSAKNNISLNKNLIFLRDELIDYVIMHELAHIRVKNHSRKFWEELERILPNSKVLNRELRNIRIRQNGCKDHL
jgi:predicted metal-dependent hydrolase